MTRAGPPILSAGTDDTSPAYLFRRREDPSLHAISRDPTGANLPTDGTTGGWVFDGMVALGVREALPLPVNPEPLLRGLMSDGFYVWQDRSNPSGTSQ
jgi:hypothetical protein